MTQCWIGLGGNLGDVPGAIAEVVHRLQTTFGEPVTVSPLFRTAPMGAAAGSEFWNAVAGCSVSVTPHDVLRQLQQWEADLGRVRDVRWGPRPIDLDLLFFGDAIVDTADLKVPHPGAWYRRFVLDPLLTLAPRLMHPFWGLTIEQLHARLAIGEPTLWLWPERAACASKLATRLSTIRPDLVVRAWNGVDPISRGLLTAWHTLPQHCAIPHLQWPSELSDNELTQALYDACTAAFDAPRRASFAPRCAP